MQFTRLMRRGGALVAVLVLAGVNLGSFGGDEPRTTIRIGTIGALAPGSRGEAAEASLKDFIRTEAQLTADVIKQKDWEQLADQLAAKAIEVGVFQSHEFVWAQQRRSTIKPLVLAVRGQRYPVIYMVVAKSEGLDSVAGLSGRPIAVPDGLGYLRVYLEQQALALGKPADAFFSKIVKRESSEDALDDVVDGAVAAAVVERNALDTFKRRKPARFAKLKELVHSQPLIPPVIAYADGGLDEATRLKFQNTLVNADKKDRGQSMLSGFKLSGFEAPADDFDTVAKRTLQTFPVPKKAN